MNPVDKIKIPEYIRWSHRELSHCSLRFLEFVRDNPETLLRSSYSPIFEFKDPYDNLQPWPVFVDKSRVNEFRKAAVEVCRLLKSIPARVFANDPYRMSRYFGLPKEEIEYFLSGVDDVHLENLLARGDFIFSSRGLKCVEFNINANLGGWVVAYLEPLYLKTPVISRFLRQQGVKVGNKNLLFIFFEHLLRSALHKFPGSESEINIVIVVPDNEKDVLVVYESGFNDLYRKILPLHHENLRGEVAFCGYEQLRVVDHRLFFREKRVHVLVEMPLEGSREKIESVFGAGNVCLFNGPVAYLLSNKLNLAALSEHRDTDFFSGEERKIIKKYIPWTRKLTAGETTYRDTRVKLEDFVISHKDEVIVKPAVGFGGQGIYCGRFFDDSRWKEVIEAVMRNENYVVQEYLESFSYLFQWGEDKAAVYQAVWGFFVFGATYAGGFVRILPVEGHRGVINTYQGARKSVIFEVEEESGT